MTKTKPAAVLIAGTMLLLAGCGGGEPETQESAGSAPAAAESSDAAASEREDVLGASMHHALDKAEAVEGEIMQQKKDIDAAVDAAEGNTDDE